MKTITLYGRIFILLLIIFSCSKDEQLPQPEADNSSDKVQLPDYSKAVFSELTTVSKAKVKSDFKTKAALPADMKQRLLPFYEAEKVNFGIGSSPIQVSGVKKLKVVYETLDPFGKVIPVSGMVVIPDQKRDNLNMLIYMHGTESDKTFSYAKLANASSELNGTVDFFVSLGLVVLFPDYIGYGESQSIPHPYEHANTLAGTGADMLESVLLYFENNPDLGTLNKKVFITGYSEGGYAAMALHRHLESKPTELSVIQTIAGAGAYDKLEFGKQVLDKQKNEILYFLPSYLWVLESYKTYYAEGKNIDYTDVYTSENYTLFAEKNFPFAYQGTTRINFSRKPVELFKASFRAQLENNTSALYKILIQENLTEWKPKAPLMLVTGDADDYVFPINTTNAYTRMKAKQANVSMKVYPGKNHSSGVPLYLADTFKEVLGLVLPISKQLGL